MHQATGKTTQKVAATSQNMRCLSTSNSSDNSVRECESYFLKNQTKQKKKKYFLWGWGEGSNVKSGGSRSNHWPQVN